MTMLAGVLSVPEALLLGIVEGITEFLPVSSTGHLLFIEHLVGLGGTNSTAADTYAVVIQFGAILAALVLFRGRLGSMLRGVSGRDSTGLALATNVVVAFLPAAFVGVVAGDAIKDSLFGPVPVVLAWGAGGALLLVWRASDRGRALEEITLRTAALVGVAQVLAMWPGVSRSLVTIVAAVALGASLSAAVEFSFLLGALTLSAATVLDLVRHGGDVVGTFGWTAPVVGLLAAFGAALLAVRWLIGHLTPSTLRGFGLYRLGAAALGLLLVVLGAV